MKWIMNAWAQYGLGGVGWYQGEGAVRKHGLYKVSKTFVKNVLALEKRM